MIKYSLCDAIDNYLVTANELEQTQRAEARADQPPNFHPSGIGYCARSLAMGMLNYPRQTPDAQSIRIFANGDSMHERYQKWFSDMGILVAEELPMKDPIMRLSARLDAIIRVTDEGAAGMLAIVELKSAKDKQFKRMLKEGPYTGYICQLQFYMHMTGIPRGVIFMENKDTQELTEWWYEYDQAMAAQLVEKAQMVVSCVDAQLLPEREYEKTSFECRFCDYAEACWGI